MQVEDVFAKGQRLVGVVPDQVVDRVDFRVAGHQDAAGVGAKLVVDGDVHLLAHLGEDAEQRGGLIGVGVLAVTGEIPFDEVVIGFGAEEAPGDDAAGVDEVLDEVVRLGDGLAFEGGPGQVVDALEAAALQQLGEAALQRHFQAGMRAEGGEDAAGARVHQGHAHHRELAAERGVLDQHREALLLQFGNAGDDAGVFG
ncbi:hypothetical protein SDC9_166015 [bioreactor metagenome]|uniref:Uncharacterized protein n=1 Tax=bioreactor metagenome TaxID=1076179 RepID=A0A645G3P7_9ZZZZ